MGAKKIFPGEYEYKGYILWVNREGGQIFWYKNTIEEGTLKSDGFYYLTKKETMQAIDDIVK